MLHIVVKDLVGQNAMTIEDGEAVYHHIHDPLVHGETVELDFDGVNIFASPFFNASIGRLLADIRPETLNTHLKIQHLSAFGDRILRRVIENAKEYFASSEAQQNAIDRIVNDTAEAM